MLTGATGKYEIVAKPPAVQVYLLGRFRVVVGGAARDDRAWRRASARQLFKCLLSRPRRCMTRGEVIELLWPDSDSDAASSNLRSTIHAMRRVLESSRAESGIGIVFTDRDNVWLRPDVELWVDADEFERAVQRAWRSPDPLVLLEQASALYTGHYLPDDQFDDWATERREVLKQYWAELQIRLSTELERRGDPDAAGRHLQRLLEVDPCDERAAQGLMRLLDRHGRRTEALRVYQHLVQALDSELGVEPSGETRALQQQVAAGKSATHTVAVTFTCGYPFPKPRTLVGREAELSLLERLFGDGKTGWRAIFIGGQVGVGKSALVGQFVKLASARGTLCLAGGCYEQHGLVPLGPFQDALTDYLLAQSPDQISVDLGASVEDVAQLVPQLAHHLRLPDTAAGPRPSDPTRVFGAVSLCLRKLAERGQLVLCLEDLHAADEATLELLQYLVRQMRPLRLGLIGTYRSEELHVNPRLAETITALRREHMAAQLVLNSLNKEHADLLITALLGGPPSGALSQWLFTTSSGNPSRIEQVALALSEGGLLAKVDGRWESATDLDAPPRPVREIVAQQLRGLSSACRETLAMAAVLGLHFETTELMAALGQTDEQLIQHYLDEAILAEVLHRTPGGFAFRHALVRDAVYFDLSAPLRMLLHAHAAHGLERMRGPGASAYATELARHFALAGQSSQMRSKAVHYRTLADGPSSGVAHNLGAQPANAGEGCG